LKNVLARGTPDYCKLYPGKHWLNLYLFQTHVCPCSAQNVAVFCPMSSPTLWNIYAGSQHTYIGE